MRRNRASLGPQPQPRSDSFNDGYVPAASITVFQQFTFLYDHAGREIITRSPAGFGATVKKPMPKMSPKYTPKKSAKKDCK